MTDKKVKNQASKRIGRPPKSKKVLESIFDAALDDEHKNQAAAWKLVMDRVLPTSYFEKDAAGGNKGGINISITGVGGEKTVISGGSAEPVAEGEYTEDV